MIKQDDIIYFIVTDRFCDGDHDNNIVIDKTDPFKYHGGDFKGIIDKISYLKELGITALWITPVYLSIGNVNEHDGYHGYWPLDFDKISPYLYSKEAGKEEGAKQYLKKLVKKLHENGIKLILDMVVNHTGYHNSSYRNYEYKKFSAEHFNKGGSGDIKGDLAGLPDLNHDIPYVADYFVQNILSWIEETGIDGIRMDTAKHVEKKFWYYFKSYIKGKYKNVTLIGEILDFRPEEIAEYQKKYDFDSVFDFPLCGTLKDVFICNNSMKKLARPRISEYEEKGILDIDSCYTNANRLVTLLDNHDIGCRIKTEILNKWGHWDRNRANRILKLCLSFLFTTRGIPQLYYGTEIGLEGDWDPYNRRDMRWEVFDDSHVEEPDDSEYKDAKEIYEHVKKLVKIRKDNHAISFGYLFTIYSDDIYYAYMREFKGNVIIVMINNSFKKTDNFKLDIGSNANIPPRIKDLLQNRRNLADQLNTEDKIQYKDGILETKLGPKQAKIYKLL